MSEAPAIVFLILATFGISLWAFNRPEFQQRYLFRPESILAGKEYYRLVTSGFVHAGWGHLLLNMYTLSAFGGVVAWAYGHTSFLMIYFGSIIGGNLLSLYLHRHHDYAAYGASGGVCGLIFAYILKFPHSRMPLFPIPYTVPAWLYALAFVIASFYAMKAQLGNISHDAHLGGAIVGLLIASGLQPSALVDHWAVVASLSLAAGLILAYLIVNPLHLPLSSFQSAPPSPPRIPPRIKDVRTTTGGPQPPPVRARVSVPTEPEPDWLVVEIEHQVGKLSKDESGRHAWVDKFGRTYDVICPTAASFRLEAFRPALHERLADPTVQFIILDTRQLQEGQVDLLRPFIADLPDGQFHRVIRSYAFKSRRT
ncbi:MAG: rhomboid family intramembrane serine protease [Verrucomicrobiota bacterium]